VDAEREQTAAAVRRSWLSTAVTAGLVGVLLLVLAHGAIAAYFDVAGVLEVFAAVVLTVVGSRRAAQVLQDSPGQARPTVVFVSLLSLVPILVVGAGLVASR
jgi:predicted tellurium resistance membrane protein TerC